MDLVEVDWVRLRRHPGVRASGLLVIAFLYYVLVVAGEIGRTGSIIVSAIPAALVLVFFLRRPTLAMALSAVGILLMAFFMVNNAGIQSAVQQVSAGAAIYGAAVSTDPRARELGRIFTGFVAVAAALFLATRWTAGGDPLLTLALPFLILCFGPWILARALRRHRVLEYRLGETSELHESAERDVLIELERNRLAREVHDVVAHSLAVVIAQADGARFAAESRPESVAPALEAISDTARRALGEVRTMLHDLRTSGEGGVVPGAADLEGLVEGVRGLGVEVDAVVYGEPRPVDRPAGLALYRVAQEALTNAMRHGGRGEPVGFEVDWGDREVVLVVTNAVPAEAVPATERSGHGVTGMRERAADAGGDCTAGVGSNGRFRVRVALPVGVEAAEPEREPEREPEPAANPLLALLGLGETAARG